MSLVKNRSKRGIWVTRWHVKIKKTKLVSYIDTVDNIIVTGNDALTISRNPIQIHKIYRRIYSKDTWKKKVSEGKITIIRVEFIKYIGESQAKDGDRIFQ